MERNNAKIKSAKVRSCAYPVLALPECSQLAQKIFDGLGQGPHTRATLAKGMGYSSFSGAVSAKIGSMVQFGLLERFHGGYSVTPLAEEIFSYPDEISQPSIAEGALRPALYKKLADRFAGKSIPHGLAAVLAAGYRITEKAAPEAAANFIKTMEFSGLLKDGILGLPPAGEAAAPVEKKSRELLTANKEDDGRIKIELPCGGAVLFPKEMAYRLSLGEFAEAIKDLDRKAGGIVEE